MMPRFDGAEALAFKVVALSITAGGTAGSVMAGGSGETILGMGFFTWILSLAGSGLVLSFMPQRREHDGTLTPWWKVVGTVAFCTLAGAGFGTLAVRWGAHWAQGSLGIDLTGSDHFFAFPAAAAAQVLVPVVVDDPKAAIASLKSLLPWGRA